jgi:hypothetical protein
VIKKRGEGGEGGGVEKHALRPAKDSTRGTVAATCGGTEELGDRR